MKLDREQIVKEWEYEVALGKDIGLKRDFINYVSISLVNNTLSLMRELTEENERLKKDNEYILMQHAFQRRPSGDCWNDVIEKSKSDTVRKMQERLKEYLDDFYNSGEDALLDVPDMIDQIAKEMLEGE